MPTGAGMHLLRILASALCIIVVSQSSLQAEERKSDVRVVIDISGSMKDTDPKNLRQPALNLLTELLPDGSRAGVWTFGRYVNMLVPLETVDSQWRNSAREASPKISSLGLNTNLVEALDRALYQATLDGGYDQTVILLTDGRIDMDTTEGDPTSKANAAERARLIRDVLPRYTSKGVRIHTLALSDGADAAMLQQIAMETDGLALKAHTADELMPAFLKAFDRAVPSEQVPLNGNTFSIDDSVKEFTALIFRSPSAKPTVLVSPTGQRFSREMAASGDQLRWHNDLNFDLITIKSPESGEWLVDADVAPDSRVQILSDLRLNVSGLPGSLFSGVPVELEIALVNEGDVVDEATILQLTDVSLQVTAPDGRTGSKLLSDPEQLPIDGIFRETLSRLTLPGEYQLEINAIGRTFQRHQVLTATLAEPMRVDVTENIDEQSLSIRVFSESDMVDSTLSRVIARVSSPDGSSVIQSMVFNDATRSWEMTLTPDKGEGQYEVMLNIRGVSSSGMTFKSKPETIAKRFPMERPGIIPEEPGVLTSESVVVAPSDAESPQPVPFETDANDATPEPEEVSEPINPAELEEEAPEPAAPEPTVPDEAVAAEAPDDVEDESGIAWWVYVILGIANLGLMGGLAWWWLSRKKKSSAETSVPDSDSKPTKLPEGELDIGNLDDADLESGDFDDFNSEAEEEIPVADDESHIPTSMGGDTDMGSAVAKEDFKIDEEAAESEGDDDEWGEFDLPDDENPKT
jgi:uncharacterized protein (TIGR03503 family)